MAVSSFQPSGGGEPRIAAPDGLVRGDLGEGRDHGPRSRSRVEQGVAQEAVERDAGLDGTLGNGDVFRTTGDITSFQKDLIGKGVEINYEREEANTWLFQLLINGLPMLVSNLPEYPDNNPCVVTRGVGNNLT